MPSTPRLTASDFHPEVLRLFDQYVHGLIDRRGFLDGAARFVAGPGAAVGVLAALSPDFAAAQKVAPGDARLKATFAEFASPQGHGSARGYLVRPAQAAGGQELVGQRGEGAEAEEEVLDGGAQGGLVGPGRGTAGVLCLNM